MRFFVGLHQPSDARHFLRRGRQVCISVNRLRQRRRFRVGDWIMDSGAFTEVSTHGGYRTSPKVYAAEVRRWSSTGNLLAAVSQDWMCEPFIVERTSLTVEAHQRLTVERYDAIAGEGLPVYVMPVLQGYEPAEYVAHLELYGDRLAHRAWVGVGSVCKRNADPRAVERVLFAIHDRRPDLRLHGFGVKATALASGKVRALLYSADSMAWSWAARRQGRNANDWREAEAFATEIEAQSFQRPLFL